MFLWYETKTLDGFLLTKFPPSDARLGTHSHDLKKTPDVLLFALYFTAFPFRACYAVYIFFRKKEHTNIMHEQSYFTQFYDMNRKKKGTFDIYSFLFIFIISFSLNSLGVEAEWVRKECRELSFCDYAQWPQAFPAFNALLWASGGCRKLCTSLVFAAGKDFVSAKDNIPLLFASSGERIMIINYIVEAM